MDALNKRKEHNQELEDEKVLNKIKEVIKNADAILIGAGAGLSTSAGLSYSGKRFEDNFSDFIDKYGMEDMYSAGFYPFNTQEEKWAYWSKHIFYNRYDVGATEVYRQLYQLVEEKNYFVLTTNVDHQFELTGFENERIFATQGDYGMFQCAKGCHNKLYENENVVKEMIVKQKDCKIPTSLVPICPVCGGHMEVNLRIDGDFVQDENWYKAADKYSSFLEENQNKKLVFFELGVGMNTPGIIKYPFWQMTNQWSNAFYICINKGEAWAPDEIRERSICIDGDIGQVLEVLGNEERVQ
ncbi:SIR2 family NAD-dependent protein deacylase [Anaeromicropila herbilytica]|uniref:SIR2 family NAD-dependent protein deacylase n=1 Tax=Anaeromicropila herbilytica TaxID=2785025 RepID=UPI0038CC02CC